MSNMFKSMSSNTKGFILIAWPLGLILTFISLLLMYEDYNTSRLGYMMLPTQKVNDDIVIFAVAALPQLAQIVLFFIFGRDTKKGWAVLLASVFFLADLATDAWYKSGGNWSLIPLATIESLFVFTLGSEVLFSIGAGFIAESFSDFVIALAFFLKSVMDGIANISKALGLSEDVPNKGENNYDRRQN